MYPFWDPVVWPILQSVRARRIVEIGALRGETTALMLERLGPDTELHVIDPVPEFDPAEHEQAFPGRYIFHRDVSHNVLPELPAVDVALIDGDHNWFTVYHELKLLDAAARRDGMPLPVLILHDVGWPYGRRDLYYAPERIPEEFRQEYAQQGIRPGTEKVLPAGGINPLHYNAINEGGTRNGVMAALDDFIAEREEPVRRLVLPVYFGLAIVVDEARLAHEPELAALLDTFESAAGKDMLMELAENTRLQAILFQHNDYYGHRQQLARAADRYLDLLGTALLDELYVDNEMRLRYLLECIDEAKAPQRAKLGDPAREMQLRWEAVVERRRAGMQPNADPTGSTLPYTSMGRARLAHLRACLDTIRTESIAGDLFECGTGRGGGAIFMRGYLDAHEIPHRKVWVADRFLVDPAAPDRLDVWADLTALRDGFTRFGLLDDRVRFLQGPAAESLTGSGNANVALLRLGPGDAADIEPALDALYHRLAFGAFVVIDDYASESRRAAIDAFRARRGVDDAIELVDGNGAFWRKTKAARGAATASEPHTRTAPIPAPATATVRDLSVIVVFYNMRREAARTLHSLSRAYQREIDDVDYEVIVIDNGSAPDQRLGEEFVRSFGPEFRYVDLAGEATPSPAHALNRGLELAGGQTLAFMIDGAHVLSPGVLHYGLAGLRTYEPAIVATQQWYIGPGQQPDVMLAGYDQVFEDKLFDHIEWPGDGYRLFDIGHFIGERDWLDGLWESNCIFVARTLLEQCGAFDERFSVAGGGYANLEFYERIGSTAGVRIVTMLGEGSFHQVHGGTTTNVADPSERRATIVGYAEQFREMYGRPFRGPGKTIHYVGTMFPAAFRTRARRMTADAFVKGRVVDGPDGVPQSPTPIPDELATGFIDAFWHSLAWRDTKWLGRNTLRAPTDLFVYQEIVSQVRPDWIIETGTSNGGRTLFLASMCELVGSGQVLSIDVKLAKDLPQHPRITYLEGRPQDADTVERVRAIVGSAPRAVVVLGSQPMSHLRAQEEFVAFREFVPVGSYVIVENTVYNGHPVWPGHGRGPFEATRRILADNGDFAADTALERFGLTFNPGGYLKRIR